MFTITPKRPIPTADQGPCTSTTLFPLGDMMLVAQQAGVLSGPCGPLVSVDRSLLPPDPSLAEVAHSTDALEQDGLGDLYLRTGKPTTLRGGQVLPPGSYLITALTPYDLLSAMDKDSHLEEIDVEQAIHSVCDPSTQNLDLALATCVSEHVRKYGFVPHVKVKASSPVEAILRTAAGLHQQSTSDPTFGFYRSFSKHTDSPQEQDRHSALSLHLQSIATAPLGEFHRKAARPSLSRPIIGAAFQACDEHAHGSPGLAMLSREFPHNAFHGWGGSLVANPLIHPNDSVQALLARSCGYAAMGYGFVAVCDKPVSLGLDKLGRLHNEEGPSVSFRDGWRLYHWHGMRGNRMLVTGAPGAGAHLSFLHSDMVRMQQLTQQAQDERKLRMKDETIISVERHGAEQYLRDRMNKAGSGVRTSPYASPDHPIPMLRSARLLCIDSQVGPAFLEINSQSTQRLIRVSAHGLSLANPTVEDIERAFASIWTTMGGHRVRLPRH